MKKPVNATMAQTSRGIRINSSWNDKKTGKRQIEAKPTAKKKKTPEGLLFLLSRFHPAWVKADKIKRAIAVKDIWKNSNKQFDI